MVLRLSSNVLRLFSIALRFSSMVLRLAKAISNAIQESLNTIEESMADGGGVQRLSWPLRSTSGTRKKVIDVVNSIDSFVTSPSKMNKGCIYLLNEVLDKDKFETTTIQERDES